jgi:hypothetical protein
MATWKGTRHYFRSQHSTYDNDAHDYFSWEYQTTSDTLMLIKNRVTQRCAYGGTVYEDKELATFHEDDEALAMYRALREWVRNYHGEEALNDED